MTTEVRTCIDEEKQKILASFSADRVMQILEERGRRVRELPAVEPLNAEFFRGSTGRTAASWSGILHFFVFCDRTRFFQKLRILSDTLERLDREFKEVCSGILNGPSGRSGARWETLECLHYDMTTCLRESEVLLKSFLRALPNDETMALAVEFESPRRPKRLRLRPNPSLSGASA